jgi:hypothetical protein
MYSSFALIKNLSSSANNLKFSNFEMTEIDQCEVGALKLAHSVFGVGVPLYGDWVYRRDYHCDSDVEERVSSDVEDTLFLLRLFKVGDLVFSRHVIRKPDGNNLRQLPYRVMSQIRKTFGYRFESEECPGFDSFASEIMSHRNWSSTWFQTARRFFLYGGSKEFKPHQQSVDRIVDYMVAMEAILVPERDFLGRRVRERAAALLEGDDEDFIKKLMRDFYDIRSTVVHGSDVDPENNAFTMSFDFEGIIRRVIVESLRKLPFDDTDRASFLKALFDVSHNDRSELVYNQFCAIKGQDEKKTCVERMTKRADSWRGKE